MSIQRKYKMIDNYIYLYHTGNFIVLPTFAEEVQDSIQANFASETPLTRSAPIYSYQNSGPRQISFNFKLHRELMYEINWGVSNLATVGNLKDDYVDYIVKAIQSIALPAYNDSTKAVQPPIIAVRLGNDIFIKGVVQGSVSVTYGLPILSDAPFEGKYASVSLSFSVTEVDPFQAKDVQSQGSYRGVSTELSAYKYADHTGTMSTIKAEKSSSTGKRYITNDLVIV